MPESPILCPSWGCEAGATLIGIVLEDGSVAFAKERIVIDQAFVDTARQGRSPETRFRFSSTCKRAACVQWADNQCGVIERVLSERVTGGKQPTTAASVDALPLCTIRPQCRWYLQSGEHACRACPEVITDQRPEVAQAA